MTSSNGGTPFTLPPHRSWRSAQHGKRQAGQVDERCLGHGRLGSCCAVVARQLGRHHVYLLPVQLLHVLHQEGLAQTRPAAAQRNLPGPHQPKVIPDPWAGLAHDRPTVMHASSEAGAAGQAAGWGGSLGSVFPPPGRPVQRAPPPLQLTASITLLQCTACTARHSTHRGSGRDHAVPRSGQVCCPPWRQAPIQGNVQSRCTALPRVRVLRPTALQAWRAARYTRECGSSALWAGIQHSIKHTAYCTAHGLHVCAGSRRGVLRPRHWRARCDATLRTCVHFYKIESFLLVYLCC